MHTYLSTYSFNIYGRCSIRSASFESTVNLQRLSRWCQSQQTSRSRILKKAPGFSSVEYSPGDIQSRTGVCHCWQKCNVFVGFRQTRRPSVALKCIHSIVEWSRAHRHYLCKQLCCRYGWSIWKLHWYHFHSVIFTSGQRTTQAQIPVRSWIHLFSQIFYHGGSCVSCFRLYQSAALILTYRRGPPCRFWWWWFLPVFWSSPTSRLTFFTCPLRTHTLANACKDTRHPTVFLWFKKHIHTTNITPTYGMKLKTLLPVMKMGARRMRMASGASLSMGIICVPEVFCFLFFTFC